VGGAGPITAGLLARGYWTNKPTPLVAWLLVLTVAASACVQDALDTSVSSALPSVRDPNLAELLHVPRPWDVRPEDGQLVPENVGTCSAVESFGDGSPRRNLLRIPERSGHRAGAEGREGVSRVRFVQWSRQTGRTVLEASCVIPSNRDDKDWAREFLRGHGRGRPGEGMARVADRPAGPSSGWWGDPYVDCTWFSFDNSMECAGTTCMNYYLDMARPAYGSLARVAGVFDTWECTNGCQVYDFSWYSCPFQPSLGGWTAGDSLFGGGSNPYDATCPYNDPHCLLPLRPSDRAKIDSAWATYLDRSRQKCVDAGMAIDSMLRNNRIYRGNPDIPDGEPNHDGFYDPSKKAIHIDQNAIESMSQWVLLGLLLHEAWHVLGYSHPAGGPPYTDPPFTEQASCASYTPY